MKIPLAALGFTSTIAQLVLMRELVATFYGNELLYGWTLMVWLIWVAAGSWGFGRLAAGRRLGVPAFAAGLLLIAALFPAQIVLVRDVRALLHVTPGAFVEFGQMVSAVVWVLAPVCLLGGFAFVLGARLNVERGGSAGQAYVWESIGAVAGGALFSFVLIHWLDPFQTAFCVAAVNGAVAAGLFDARARSLVRRFVFPIAILIVLAVAGLFVGRVVHETTLRRQWSDLAFAADSPYGRLVVQARDGQRAFFENGLLMFETQGTFPEEVVHFPLLAHPAPRRVLLIGGGVSGDLREILKHPIEEVTYVELDPLLIQVAEQYLPEEDAASLREPRVKLVLTDGRQFVKNAPDTFDVAILDLPEPATGALNRFYTREFFEEVRAKLNPGGIFSLGLPSAENYWSPELARRNGSIYHTLRAVFSDVVVLPGEHNFFLSSEAPLRAAPAIWSSRLAERGVETRWVTPDYIGFLFTTDRFARVRRDLEATAGVRLNTDLMPICYYYDLALWLSRFYPHLRQTFERAGLINLGWVAVPLAFMVVWVRWRRQWAVPAAIAGIGLAGMILEIVIVFAFQVFYGSVYTRVSVIVSAFMAGLAVGSAVSNGMLEHWLADRAKKSRWALIGLQAAIGVYAGLFLLALGWPPLRAPAAFFSLALVGGGLTGMAFPLAVAYIQEAKKEAVSRAVGMLYGADLAGGCVGALLSVVIFVPVLGIPQTCIMIALVGLAGLLALL